MKKAPIVREEITEQPLTGNVAEETVIVIDVPEEQPEAESKPAVSEILEMKRQWEAHRESAIKRLLSDMARVKADLAELGYSWEEALPAWVKPASASVLAASKPAVSLTKVKRRATAKKSRSTVVKFCPVCNMDTNHDGRAHRYQKRKKPFTAKEIEALQK